MAESSYLLTAGTRARRYLGYGHYSGEEARTTEAEEGGEEAAKEDPAAEGEAEAAEVCGAEEETAATTAASGRRGNCGIS